MENKRQRSQSRGVCWRLWAVSKLRFPASRTGSACGAKSEKAFHTQLCSNQIGRAVPVQDQELNSAIREILRAFRNGKGFTSRLYRS